MAHRTDWFMQDRFGLFIHWGLYAIPARGEWVRTIEKIPDAAYHNYFKEFNPTRYDPATWARLAKAAGMKYAVMTVKHHEGFCLWDSAHTEFKANTSPAGRDLIRPYVNALRHEGLQVGFYYSLIDWQHPQFTLDRHHPLRDLPPDDPQRTDRHLPAYVDYMHAQVRELLTNYGKIDILWFDFSYDDKRGEAWRARDLVKMIRELQPDILLNNRLGGSHEHIEESASDAGDINTPEQMIPHDGLTDSHGRQVVWESCITLNDHWGYNRDDHNFKTPAEVIRMLVECVSKNGNLLLNVGPNAKGEIQSEAVEILEHVGKWIAVNGESIYGAGPAPGMTRPDWGFYTRAGNTLYAHVFERPMGPICFENLAGKVERARFLADGSELPLYTPWNVPPNSPHLFVNLPRTPLLDPLDTVIALELK